MAIDNSLLPDESKVLPLDSKPNFGAEKIDAFDAITPATLSEDAERRWIAERQKVEKGLSIARAVERLDPSAEKELRVDPLHRYCTPQEIEEMTKIDEKQPKPKRPLVDTPTPKGDGILKKLLP